MRTKLGILLGAVIACASALKADVALDAATGVSCSEVSLNSGGILLILSEGYGCAGARAGLPY